MTTTATETTAPAQEQINADAEVEMRADRQRVKELAGSARTLDITNRLEIGRIVLERMESNVGRFSRSREGNASVRAQTAALFALDLSEAYGVKCDDKEVYRLARLHLLSTLVDQETATKLSQLSYWAARTLVRWVDHRPDDNVATLQFRVNIGVKDEHGISSKTIDATPLLMRLISSLAGSPKSPATVAKMMDAVESDARDAEIDGLRDKDRKRAAAVRAQAQRQDAARERSQTFDQIARRVQALGLTPDEIWSELLRTKVVEAPDSDFDVSKGADMDEDEATLLGKLLVQRNNLDAIAALARALMPIIQESTSNTQPGKRATSPLHAAQVRSVA